MKKLKFTLLFIILFTVVLIASCGDNSTVLDKESDNTNNNEETIDGNTTEETRLNADLPTDIDYNGYEFKVLHWSHSAWESTARASRDIFAESQTGDPINDAVYLRNMKVEETYNVKILLQKEELGTMSTTIINNVSAGDDTFDVVYPRLYEGASLMTQGLFLDLNEMPYLDLDKPWWDQNAVNSLSVGGKLYLVATDININDKDATSAIAFNKKIANDYNIPDLYEAVKDGKWTFDYMKSVYANVSSDLNGDGIIDMNDIYGFLGKNDVTVSFFNGGGGTFVDKDENDIPYFAFYSERNIAMTQKIIDLMRDENNFFNHQTAGIDDLQYTKMFEEGHGLFFWMRLDEVTNMRASDTDFGILPTPKYDEIQSQYWNTVSRHTTGLMSVPITSEPERTSIILEALAAESKYTLQPAYYDVSLIGKSTRDVESEGMLEIIMAGRVFDLGSIFAFGGFEDQYLGLGKIGGGDIVSLYEKFETQTIAAIDNFIEKIETASN